MAGRLDDITARRAAPWPATDLADVDWLIARVEQLEAAVARGRDLVAQAYNGDIAHTDYGDHAGLTWDECARLGDLLESLDDAIRALDASEPTPDVDAPEPCPHCTSFRTVEPGLGHDASTAPIVVCRRLEAGMCPTMHASEPTP